MNTNPIVPENDPARTAGSASVAHTPSTVDTLPVRGVHYRVRRWGSAGAPKVFLLHGWMDSSATFQFVVDALRHDWQLIAPDWRGFGGSSWLGRPYWFPDYYADLEVLLDHYAPDAPVRLVGHSMGAAVAGVYAGLRPARVRQLAMLDFLGLKPPPEVDAPALLGKWLNGQAEPPQMRAYADHAAFARRLRTVNPRLSEARADFLARHVTRVRDSGEVELAGDPWHKLPSPFVYRIEDVMACWRRITAPTLVMESAEGYVRDRFGDDPDDHRRRLECFADLRVLTIAEAGHNLQHDQPEAVAAALETFLQRD